MTTEVACQPVAFRFPRVLFRLASGLALGFTIVGCGGGDPSLVRVSGIVTIDGQPLKDATVEFVPETGWGSLGKTDDTGRYELLYRARKEGAVVGQHQVRISTKIEQDRDSTNPDIQKGRKESIPAMYNTASTLEAYLEAGKSVELNFDLKSKTTR
jgi:hypothetical protein